MTATDPLLARLAPRPSAPGWELAAEAIAVRIRWFGLAVGVLLAHATAAPADRPPLYAILTLGFAFTAADTAFFLRGRVFLKDAPLVISALESLFIALLCHFESGPESAFRFYYLLSLVCCAIRYSQQTTVATCGLDYFSYGLLYAAQPPDRRDPQLLLQMLVLLGWVTGAAGAMAGLLKRGGEDLRRLNAELRDNQALLETRIAERSRELEESQAQVLHQEKMAAFGLLAAGIAHEVGNPLAAISNLVQLLERRDHDADTRDKLASVGGQLVRIQAILRELILFSRPASGARGRVHVADVVAESLGLAKYYRGGKNRQITADVPDGLPTLVGVRDQLVQVVFNLILNAIDATGKGGKIVVAAAAGGGRVVLTVADDGAGIPPDVRDRLFRPYFTTKRHGTGLGLFVVSKIVEEHGGSVCVESEVGKGATFRVEVPAPETMAR